MRTEIFVEKTKLDLTGSISARINKSINDIRKPSSKNTAFTRTIKLPSTQANDKAFGFVFSDNRSINHNENAPNIGANFSPSRSAKCIIYQDSFIAVRGIIRVLNIVKRNNVVKYYEVAIFGELGGFISKIAEKFLHDLDFSAYNTSWTAANVAGSWSSFGSGSGLTYPLIDYGLCSVDKKDFDLGAFRPAFYYKELIDKIFAMAGYTYDCPFFNSAFFKKIIMPNNEDRMYKLVTLLLQRSNNTAVSNYITYNTNWANLIKIPFPTGSLANFSSNGAQDEFTFSGTQASGKIDYDIQMEFRAQAQTSTQYFVRVRVWVGSTVVGYHVVNLVGETPPVNWYPINLVGNNIACSLNPGDIVKVDVLAQSSPFNPTPPAFWINFKSASMQVRLANAQPAPMEPGDTLMANNCLPKGFKQYDFIDSVINAFNLHIVEDKVQERKLIIRPYPDFYQKTIASRQNWSEKVDRSQDMSYTPMGELTSRAFNFKFDKDEDYYNDTYSKRHGKTYGDRIVPTNFEFGNEEKDIKLMFAPTPIVGPGTQGKVFPAIYKVDSNGEQRMSSKLRMLMGKYITGLSTQWNFKNWIVGIGKVSSATNSTTVTGSGTNFVAQAVFTGDQIVSKGVIVGTVQSVGSGTQLTLTGNATINMSSEDFYIVRQLLGTFPNYLYAGHLDDPDNPTIDLSWDAPNEVFYNLTAAYPGNNLYTAYWKHFIDEIAHSDSSLLTCYIKFKPADIYNLDFSSYKFIDGCLYRLNKIIDHDTEANVSTKTELLKVINPLT